MVSKADHCPAYTWLLVVDKSSMHYVPRRARYLSKGLYNICTWTLAKKKERNKKNEREKKKKTKKTASIHVFHVDMHYGTCNMRFSRFPYASFGGFVRVSPKCDACLYSIPYASGWVHWLETREISSFTFSIST